MFKDKDVVHIPGKYKPLYVLEEEENGMFYVYEKDTGDLVGFVQQEWLEHNKAEKVEEQ